jgi:hypothetical protein
MVVTVRGTLERLHFFFVSPPHVLRYRNADRSAGHKSCTRCAIIARLHAHVAFPQPRSLLLEHFTASPVQTRNSQHSATEILSAFHWTVLVIPMSLPVYSEQIHARKRRIVTLRLLYRPGPVIALLCLSSYLVCRQADDISPSVVFQG